MSAAKKAKAVAPAPASPSFLTLEEVEPPPGPQEKHVRVDNRLVGEILGLMRREHPDKEIAIDMLDKYIIHLRTVIHEVLFRVHLGSTENAIKLCKGPHDVIVKLVDDHGTIRVR